MRSRNSTIMLRAGFAFLLVLTIAAGASAADWRPYLEVETQADGIFVVREALSRTLGHVDAQPCTFNPTLNTPGVLNFGLRRPPDYREKHALIRFDLSDLPADAVVLHAQLRMNCIFESEFTDNYLYASRVTEDWSPAEVNWCERHAGTPWCSPGSCRADEDRAQLFLTGDFDTEPNLGLRYDWLTWDVTGIVAGWHAGLTPNYGFCIWQDPAAMGNDNQALGLASEVHREWDFAHVQLGDAAYSCDGKPLVMNAGCDLAYDLTPEVVNQLSASGAVLSFEYMHVLHGGTVHVYFNDTQIGSLAADGGGCSGYSRWSQDVTPLLRVGRNLVSLRDQGLNYSIVGDFRLDAGPATIACEGASTVEFFAPGEGTAHTSAANMLGIPDGEAVPLGSGGRVVLWFERAILNGPGTDLRVHENGTSDGALENYLVEASADGEVYYLVGEGPGDSSDFDLAAAGLERAIALRITDLPPAEPGATSPNLGADIDAVEVFYCGELIPIEAAVRSFSVEVDLPRVTVEWESGSCPGPFELIAASSGATRVIAHQSVGPGQFQAVDELAFRASGQRLTYSLYSGGGEISPLLASREVEIPRIDPVTRLFAPSPNPFNPSVAIRFWLGRSQDVRIAIFDMAGRQVALLLNAVHGAGEGLVRWNGQDQVGRSLPAGTYLVRLKAEDGEDTQKALLLR